MMYALHDSGAVGNTILVGIMSCLFTQTCTTVNNGSLGSRNDEERSEMRYVMRIAEFSESSNL